jgi:hypothetical protein
MPLKSIGERLMASAELGMEPIEAKIGLTR